MEVERNESDPSLGENNAPGSSGWTSVTDCKFIATLELMLIQA